MQITSAPDGTILIDGKVVTALDRFVAAVTAVIERYTGYLWMVFRDMLDSDLLRSFTERLHARGEPYGIEV